MAAGYKINIQRSMVLLHTSNNLKMKLRKIPLTIAPKYKLLRNEINMAITGEKLLKIPTYGG